MTSPTDVARFHAEYDIHPGDRVGLFGAVAEAVPSGSTVLYPGSYVDITPSVWFDEVTYVDTDKRADTFFDCADAVLELVDSKRSAVGTPAGTETIEFHHLDYRTPLPFGDQAFDLLVSLYAGFISEHCTNHLRVGGTLLVNPSHGDVAMASIDPRYELSGVVTSGASGYRVRTDELDTYLIPKKQQTITVESLHERARGVGYTRSPFAYLFTRRH